MSLWSLVASGSHESLDTRQQEQILLFRAAVSSGASMSSIPECEMNNMNQVGRTFLKGVNAKLPLKFSQTTTRTVPETVTIAG